MSRERDRGFLRAAARVALRGHGGAEPNPMVGCLIVNPAGAVVGTGYHRRCGGPHAEVNAIADAGDATRGATAYVTLEPCNHTGRTGPCSEALLAAGVARVVIGRREHGDAAGGATRLREAGVAVEFIDDDPVVLAPAEPFVHRLRTGRPWVIAKWAQTIDGRIATRTGASQWISGPQSRALVHRQRGRVDAILTGIGTILADDARLTARTPRPRRIPRRVIIDPELRTPADAAILRDIPDAPVTIACRDDALASPAVDWLRNAGVDLLPVPAAGADLPLAPVLETLSKDHETATVLVEAGAGLLGRLFRERLVNEAWVFTAPLLFGDEEAMPCVRGLTAAKLTDSVAMETIGVHRRGDDVLVRYVASPRG